MRCDNKIVVMGSICAFVIACVAATKPEEPGEKFKNLKILSKNISDDEMDRVMYTFQRQLGVACSYCHAHTKGVTPERIDFASDEKKEKIVARDMLKMTIKINKKYFNFIVDKKVSIKPVIWCKTCHRGYPVPHINSFDYKKIPD